MESRDFFSLAEILESLESVFVRKATKVETKTSFSLRIFRKILEKDSQGRSASHSNLLNDDVYGPVHTAPFLYKSGEKNLHFCESVHTDLHKNATKTEDSENALDQCELTKKRRFFKTLQHPTMSFTQTEQCERGLSEGES